MTSQSLCYKSSGNPVVLWAKSTNFQGLVFIPKMEKLLLWDLKWKGKTQINV